MTACNRILTAIVILITITANSAHGKSDQSFDKLLDAYLKAKFNYKVASDINNYSEKSYWMDQYFFYASKMNEMLDDAYRAAKKNPYEFCLQALKMYSKYINESQKIIVLDGMDIVDNSMYRFNMMMDLLSYCARYEIFYNPYDEKMK
jgi:hypothetical protein